MPTSDPTFDENDFPGDHPLDEPATFGHLFRKYYDLLVRYFRRYTRTLPEAQDIAVDSLLKLPDKKDDFTEWREVLPFLLVAGRHAAIDNKRHSATAERFLQTQPSTDTAAESWEALQDNATVFYALHQAVARCKPRVQQVFHLHFYKGLSKAAIARQLGVSTRTIQRDFKSLIQQLQKVLAAHGYL